MLFTDRKYVRSETASILHAPAAARIDLRDKRKIRRNPNLAAVIRAERIVIANSGPKP